ncbi:PREDICTED: UDP-glycosyltransferase 79B30-like [Nelumbo nucifera]|uniref:Glycosyltransferase n=2 Tax=Nelumbo nucifera TaxID=4432 RepID=A0A1U8AEU7_NELNU|nr:PREDICTED: UDP-glycosyltransferase 79B30-like [Nelumbo nucifera]DAD22765.1 TPA_asm: hypothetical protein HUJ06_024228 [Nelumbo nucifera]
MMASPSRRIFHVAMYPWFAIGHITPYLHLSNKLAEKGHRVSFFLPLKTKSKLEHLNRYPHLIRFITIPIARVDGLPPTAETTADVSSPMVPLLMTTLDLTKDHVEAFLLDLKPDLVFYDLAYWLPALARHLGIKSIHYSVVSSAASSYLASPARMPPSAGVKQLTQEELMQPPMGYPSSSPFQIRRYETRDALLAFQDRGDGLTFYDMLTTSFGDSDAICFRTCREIEGPYCDYMATQYGKPVLLTGPLILPAHHQQPNTRLLDEPWSKWLGNFKEGSVVYCAFGSECILQKDQFQELVLGFELTGLPFLVALKPPHGASTIEEALPDGFKERVQGRGVVHGGWVPQTQILSHPSVGCFVSHCGYGSMWESLVSSCQIVLIPNYGDQFMHTQLLTRSLKVAVEVERREEDGWFSRESVCKAIRLVMDGENQIRKEVKANHVKWRDFLLDENMQSSYIDAFIHDLRVLLGWRD